MVLRPLLLANALVATDAAVERANPIRKVVNMLQAMQKKVQAEGERDKALFDKFMCYCKTGVGELEKSVGDANTRIPSLGSDIEEAEASVVQMKQDVKTAQTDRADAKAAVASATSLREKEAAEFAKESTELKTNIDAINKAVSAINAGMGGAFLQTRSAEMLKNIVQTSGALEDVDRQDVMAFLAGGSSAPSTLEISGILKQMGEKMSADLKDISTTENESIASFESLIAAKTKEINALNAQIETKTVRIGELGVEVVQMKNDLSDSEAQLIEDQKFLKDIKKDCETKASEYEEIVKTRQEELLALADTIKLLNDDDALELFKKTLPGASLLQMGVNQGSVRTEAMLAVKRAQSLALAPRLRVDLISMALKGKKIGFEKVIAMIDDMVATLKQEQLDDEHKREYCGEQFDLTEDKKKGLERKINGLETRIIDSKDGIAKTKDEIAALEDSIKSTDKLVAEMTEQRKEESKEYQELMTSNGAAKELLEFAKNRLNKFYNPKLYNPEKAAASFLQISVHKQEPPPEAPGAYKKKGEESNGVVAMIDILIKDLDKGMTEAEVTEKNAQKDYEGFMQDATESRMDASKSLTDKTAASADLKTDLENAGEEKSASEKELMATESYAASLHAECDWLLKYFDMRKEARAGELDSLNQAKAVLSGADFSFIQTGNILRRSKAPEDELAQEMTHDLEMNFNKIAPFGKEDTAKELQDHASKTQDTLVDAVENAEVAEIKRAVFRALTRLRAATIKEFDTIARLETQAIDAYNDAHHYRAENPLTHLHEDEAPVETDKLKSFH